MALEKKKVDINFIKYGQTKKKTLYIYAANIVNR